jgi:hypothetical protein
MKAFVFFILLLSIATLKGQIVSNPYQNSIILNHYSVQDLQSIQQTDSVKFKTICYYYTQSFVFEQTECIGCTSTITINEFDISQYEYMRQKNKRFTRYFEKYGFKVTFLSIDELSYKLPIHYTK